MNEVRKGSIYYISFWSTYTTKLFIDFPWSLIKKILKSVVMWRCGAWILPVLVGLFCLVSRPFLQNQSVLRMRALIFLVLVFVFVYLRLGSYLYLSSKQTVNAHAPRWLMAFICHSDRATLISTAAVPSHLQARLVLPRPLDNHHPEGRYSCPKGVCGGGVGVCGSGFGAWGRNFKALCDFDYSLARVFA